MTQDLFQKMNIKIHEKHNEERKSICFTQVHSQGKTKCHVTIFERRRTEAYVLQKSIARLKSQVLAF